MNDNKEFEFLTEEELKELDEQLQKAEKTELPESLSSENIENLIKDVPQDEASVEPTKPKKRNKKKIILSSISAAAAVIVAVTSVAVIRPWEKIPPAVKDSVIGNPPKETQDYTEIEELFAGYADKYKSYRTYNDTTLKGFGNIFGDKATDDALILEEAVDMEYSYNMNTGAAPGAQAEAESGSVTIQTTTTSDNVTADKNQHGETNEQVQGVSEADIIKNDGKYLYIVSPDNADWDTYYQQMSSYNRYKNGLAETTYRVVQSTPGYNPNAEDVIDKEMPETKEKEGKTTEAKEVTEHPVLEYSCEISIVEPDAKGELKSINKIEIAKPEREDIFYMDVQEIYVVNNRLIALLNCQLRNHEKNNSEITCDCYYGSKGKNIAMAVSYDISDRSNVKEEWRIFQDGGYISSRLIGDELVLLSNYYVDISQDVDVVKENCVPKNSCDGKEFSRVAANDICIMEDVYDTSYLVASVLDTDDKNTLKTEAVLGAGQNVYCTTETLYATSTEYNTGDARKAEVFDLSSTEKTQIYKFDIRNYDIKYLKNASVDGSALNQFSMDEFNGYLRIATTSGDWGENLINQVYVLDSNLETVGLLKDIAKGERIKSVRFTGNTAYVVTFVQTDPLFVIDLTDVTAPKILGELKIPGYSAYLHPVGDGLVMGVGLDGTETGTNGGMKVSLFDVSDPTEPVECGKFTMAGYDSDNRQVYVDSDAYYDHKALCWDAENKIMYVPYSKTEHQWAYSDDRKYNKTTAGIVALEVNEDEKSLKVAGDYIANATDYAQPDEFSRATYINDVVFGYSTYTGLLCSFDKSTQKQLDTFNISR